jgi:hypothetical protein
VRVEIDDIVTGCKRRHHAIELVQLVAVEFLKF